MIVFIGDSDTAAAPEQFHIQINTVKRGKHHAKTAGISTVNQTLKIASTSVGTDLYPHMPILRPHAARYSTNGAA